MTQVVSGSLASQFEYNGVGDRTRQWTNGVETQYRLDPVGLTQVLAESTGGQTIHYLPGLAQYSNNSWVYQLPDPLGSVRQLVDVNQQVVLAQSYTPFGNVLEQVGAGSSGFGYTGQQHDPSAGLIYLRARYYDPMTGRFLTPDSIIPDLSNSQSLNRYAYVYNNPIRYTDPSGHCIGVLAGIDTLTCASILALSGVFLVYAGYVVTSPPFQEALEGVIESFPSAPPRIGTVPPFDLGTCPNPTSFPTPTLGDIEPPIFIFPLYETDKIPQVFEFPGSLGLDLPHFLSADTRPSREIKKAIRSLKKQIAKHQEKINKRIGFDPVSDDPVINQRAAEARLRHLQHEIDVFSKQIKQLTQELIRRGETP